MMCFHVSRVLLGGLSLAVFALVFGCGETKNSQLPVVPAKGKVTVNGQPGAKLMLVFVPSKTEQGVKPSTTTSADGSFDVRTYTTGDGAPEGEYKVTVSVAGEFDPTLSDSKREELAAQRKTEAAKIPIPYQKAETTPLTVKIEKGKPDLGVLEIK
jgi:hypothetical protein